MTRRDAGKPEEGKRYDRDSAAGIDGSVQRGDHLVVEADSPQQLSPGMQGFRVGLARGLNRLMGRRC